MKTLLILILSVIALCVSDIKNTKITSKYNCHITIKKKGRCTGSAYCNACRNCSRCAYCSNGGSCGVCGGGSNYYSAPKKTKTSPSISNYHYSTSKVSRNYYENETIIIYNETINLRKGPGLEYEIIEKLYSSDSVTFLEKDGEWLKVTVENSGTTGYVYANLLK